MSELRHAVERYLAIRRTLGFELRVPGTRLRRFAEVADAEGAARITTDLALRWATQPAQAQPSTWACRLAILRRFAVWYTATDPLTEVPPDGLLPHRYRRKPPYIYTAEEIAHLLHAAWDLRSSKGLRAHTFATLFGLLAVTGMRITEALRLNRTDVDRAEGILTIRRTKFATSRVLPVHPSCQAAVKAYAEARDRILPGLSTPAFFATERRTRVTEGTARYTFAKVSQRIGLRDAAIGHGCGPRLHDLRHRFATQTLVNWYRAGLDVEREIPKLATYLGHVHVHDTYWYLEAVPELLQLATDRVIERRQEVRP